jgi:hypothetical protein
MPKEKSLSKFKIFFMLEPAMLNKLIPEIIALLL